MTLNDVQQIKIIPLSLPLERPPLLDQGQFANTCPDLVKNYSHHIMYYSIPNPITETSFGSLAMHYQLNLSSSQTWHCHLKTTERVPLQRDQFRWLFYEGGARRKVLPTVLQALQYPVGNSSTAL